MVELAWKLAQSVLCKGKLKHGGRRCHRQVFEESKPKGSASRRFLSGLSLHAMAATCLAQARSKAACSLEPSSASLLVVLSSESSQAK